MKISKYKVPFQSLIFKHEIVVVATSRENALQAAKCAEPFAPDSCFGVPEEIEVLHEAPQD